jgi:hypothetical protein
LETLLVLEYAHHTARGRPPSNEGPLDLLKWLYPI